MNSTNRRTVLRGGATLTAVLLLAACGTSQSNRNDKNSEAVKGISPSLVKAAQKEGGVVIRAGGHTRPVLEALQKDMQNKFGIRMQFTRVDSSKVVNAVSAELASGNVSTDVVSLTDPGAMQKWNTDGVLADAGISNLDDMEDGMHAEGENQIAYSFVPLGVMYNSSNTKTKDVPTTWEELSKQDFGKVITSNPNASGTALAFYTALDGMYGEQWVKDFSTHNPTVTDSSLALAQLVLTGEDDLGIPAIESAVSDAAKQGEPLKIAFMKDMVPTFPTEIAVLNDAPHPNAAKLLVQYHLSEEFQNELVKMGGRSVLKNAPTPPNSIDLSDYKIVPVSLADIAKRGDAVSAYFKKLLR